MLVVDVAVLSVLETVTTAVVGISTVRVTVVGGKGSCFGQPQELNCVQLSAHNDENNILLPVGNF